KTKTNKMTSVPFYLQTPSTGEPKETKYAKPLTEGGPRTPTITMGSTTRPANTQSTRRTNAFIVDEPLKA
ncbi:MAG: hypothetical protein AAF645_26645, partial [Myxococcota bacterium]